MTDQINKYDESSIQVLEGLEAVRKRPGMYIGSTDTRGLHHLVWEIVDNAIDEALAGYCTEIMVTMYKDNSVSVSDNGRGVPIGMHSSGRSTPEVIFAVLHAGGKFEEGVYKTSGGLHGVGSSVVNALSDFFEVTINRDGKTAQILFTDGGHVKTPLKIIGKSNTTGTTVRFHPDAEIFSVIEFSFTTISERLKESAFLNSGLKIVLRDEKLDKEVTYQYNDGLKEFVEYMNDGKEAISPIIMLNGSDKGIGVEVAMQYTADFNESLVSFANNVKTFDGGSHVTGFRSGLTKAVNEYARKENLLKDKDKNFELMDVKEGLNVIVSIKIPENLIQYEGQTKSRLGTPEARIVVEQVVSKQFMFWLTENKTVAYQIVDKCLLARSARDEARKARELARSGKKRSDVQRQLTGKLSPAQSKLKIKNEIFLVEGDSAGGTAKQGRDKRFQAILPLRGKVINAAKSKLADLLKNEEINTMIYAIGAGYGNNFDLSDANYGKIIIMTDADTDGAHIQTLLLTFFYRYMRPLIEARRVFIALPPLFMVSYAKQKEVQYAWDEAKLKELIKKTRSKYEIQRYKGLGEMSFQQLWDTTMNPETRQLITVTIDDAAIAEKRVEVLMGDNATRRKAWIDENVQFTLEDDFINITARK